MLKLYASLYHRTILRPRKFFQTVPEITSLRRISKLTHGVTLPVTAAKRSRNLENYFSSRTRHLCTRMTDPTSLFTLPNNQSVVAVECETAFNALNLNEKLYAHYLSQAAWNGGLIVLVQTSPESPYIFALLHKIFISEDIAQLKQSAIDAGITEDEFTAFLVYTCGVLANAGNYKAFGDTKIIPNIPMEKFETIMKVSKAYKENAAFFDNVWGKIKTVMYSIEGKYKCLGLGEKGVTTYFSANCTQEDAKLVSEFMLSRNLESCNARCLKVTSPDDNVNTYEIRLASVETGDAENITLPETTFKNAKFKITRGDYSELLVPVVENLEKAKKYAANETQKKMIDKYIEHFRTGSLDAHRDGSRFWIKDKGPVIETYIGFIETYRDPAGERAEFEGFVAMVNKEMTKKFSSLVENAENYIERLPWGREFEKDQFLRPDFTSLDILMFSGSIIPSGINIPNYDEIRQSEGFKNVSLGNVLPANMKQNKIAFLSEEDQNLLNQYRELSFEVQVGLHELLGHGTGKLLQQTGEGSFNFDRKTVKNPLTGEPIDKYFLPGETYNSKFGSMGSAYEECRAEAVGLYLSLDKDIVSIFGYTGAEADDIIYVNWLSLLWNGCAKALQMYEPTTKTWLQAHSQARYVILRVCMEAGSDFVNVVENEPGKNLLLTVDRTKIPTVGKKAMEEFLRKLQIYKSMGDVAAAKEMFDRYSDVPESGPHPWARWRDIVLAHKESRKIFVQPNTFLNEPNPTEVQLKNYEPTFTGLIQSWVERFPVDNVSQILIKLAEKDKQHFPL